MNGSFSKKPENFFLILVAAWGLYGACTEFYNIAWGTGIWLGQFSPKWALTFFIFISFCVLCLIAIGIIFLTPKKLEPVYIRLVSWRDKLGFVRWIFAILTVITPVYVLQYTFWGIVLHGIYLRILMVMFSAVSLGWLLTNASEEPINWQGFLMALLLVFSTIVFFEPLGEVTSYPFSLGWSEGNRLWDYSVMFGRSLYDYPAGKPIPVYLDIGRQFVGGIPFLFPRITIWHERLWLALVAVIPYLILGWFAYWLPGRNRIPWILAGIWAFTFVRQGPIHPPLLLCAIIVAIAWGRPLWLALPLIAGASYFAEVSRFTWIFAPGMWAAMLELGSARTQIGDLDTRTWKRAISVGFAGLLGGLLIPHIVPMAIQWANSLGRQITDSVDGGVTLTGVEASISSQPLLWYRLLPNETYGPGILISLILAVTPVIIVLVYLVRTRQWKLNGWQKLAIVLSLLAFLVVGLIVSTKIGGGGDLHNLDMFIIGLMFAGAIAWRNGGQQWFCITDKPIWMQIMVVALIVIPGYWPLMNLRPVSVTQDVRTIALLADISSSDSSSDPLPDSLLDVLPSEEDTLEALNGIRAEVERAAPLGEILFMDQRQLLTFGYVDKVPLVPEYDKKVLIDKALSADAAYFEGFYRDLAAHRFSLIISNPLHEIIKVDEAGFGEENNAWVKWVSAPILCYYEPQYTLKRVTVQILVPRSEPLDCASVLP